MSNLIALYKKFGSREFFVKNDEGENLLLYALKYNHIHNFMLNSNEWFRLFKKSDLLVEDLDGYNALQIAVNENVDHKLFLTPEHFDFLVRHSLLEYGRCHSNLFSIALNNKGNELNLFPSTLDYVIRNSPYHFSDSMGSSMIGVIFRYNKKQNLNLQPEQLNYLIYNTNLPAVAKSDTKEYGGWNPLLYALCFNESSELFLTYQQIEYLYSLFAPKAQTLEHVIMPLTIFSDNNIKSIAKSHETHMIERQHMLLNKEVATNINLTAYISSPSKI